VGVFVLEAQLLAQEKKKVQGKKILKIEFNLYIEAQYFGKHFI
jgi:hypothetical protein